MVPDLETEVTPETPDAPEMPDHWVWLARIRRSQGHKGEVFCEILTDFPEKFADRRQLWLLAEPDARAGPGLGRVDSLLPHPIQLQHHWLHKGGVVLHFAGVDSITDAERLTGMIVAIPREQRAVLSEDEVYISDLAGCALVDVANPDAPVTVGQIEDVQRDVGPVPILMVRSTAGEVLVPFAKDYLRRMDLENKRVEMALPEGLVDLNAASGS